MSYFEQLQQDWDTLGFHHKTPIQPAYPIEPLHLAYDPYTSEPRTGTYTDLHRLLLNMSRNIAAAHDPKSSHEVTVVPSDLVTDFGRRLLFLCKTPDQNITANRTCKESEPFFVRSLNPDVIRDDTMESPVIVTRHSEIIGVIKQLGQRGYEKNYYALQDDPLTATYAGNIYLAQNPPFQAPTVSHSWTIPIDEIRSYISENRRLATFSIPVDSQKYLLRKLDHSVALTTSHEQLIKLAEQAFENTVRVDPTFLYAEEKEQIV